MTKLLVYHRLHGRPFFGLGISLALLRVLPLSLSPSHLHQYIIIIGFVPSLLLLPALSLPRSLARSLALCLAAAP